MRYEKVRFCFEKIRGSFQKNGKINSLQIPEKQV